MPPIFRNTAVSLVKIPVDGENITINMGVGSAHTMNESSFRQILNEVDRTAYLMAFFAQKLEAAGIDPLTVSFETLKANLDGNYKI